MNSTICGFLLAACFAATAHCEPISRPLPSWPERALPVRFPCDSGSSVLNMARTAWDFDKALTCTTIIQGTDDGYGGRIVWQ
jgi:hypothetical protein